MCEEPTDRQRQLLVLVYESARRCGYQPSYAELGAALGCTKNAVSGLILALVRKGYLGWGDGEARALRILRRPDGRPFDGFSDSERLSRKQRAVESADSLGAASG